MEMHLQTGIMSNLSSSCHEITPLGKDSHDPGGSEQSTPHRPGRKEQPAQHRISEREQIPPVPLPPAGTLQLVWQWAPQELRGHRCAVPAPLPGTDIVPAVLRPTARRGCSHTRDHCAPTLPHSSCSAASQPPQSWEPSSLRLLPLPSRSPGLRRLLSQGACARGKHREREVDGPCSQPGCLLGKLYLYLQSQVPLGPVPEPALGREMFWGCSRPLCSLFPEELFFFQAALQHSNKKRFAMQRKTSHLPLSSVWAERRAESSRATSV